MEEVDGRRRSTRLLGKKKPDDLAAATPKKRQRPAKKDIADLPAKSESTDSLLVDQPISHDANLEQGFGGDSFDVNAVEDVSCDILQDIDDDIENVVDFPIGKEPQPAISFKLKVKQTLRAFNSHYLHFVQAEQNRVKELEEARASQAKDGETNTGNDKKPSKRPDLKAITKMQEEKTVLFPEKRIGNIPGIDIGDQFFSRAEMVVLGLHSHWLNGIDYMGQKYTKMRGYENHTFPIAVCIVLSGMYEDDLDKSEEIIYTGQGGHDLLGNKKQISDQKMERGNLALKNCIDSKVPVRVIRGHESKNSYCGRVYTYDGLYQVVAHWAEKGLRGFTVFKYRLKRLQGQTCLTTSQVRFTREEIPKSTSDLRGLVCEDISKGQEQFQIPATNIINDEKFVIPGFVYSSKLCIPQNLKIEENVAGCNCVGDCADSRSCSCSKLNGSDFAYVRKDCVRLVEAKKVIFECGHNCKCSKACINRTSQQGLKYHFEVFMTASKGWGVRSWDSIPPGAPICEYTGILRRCDEVDGLHENNYIFDIDCAQTMECLDGREERSGDISFLPKPDSNAPEYCIDAGSTGNIARFINHSCEPNLFVQCILSGHHNLKLAKVMLFAADTIPPLQELTYDYGYTLDSVVGADGKVVKKQCNCGASVCRKRLY